MIGHYAFAELNCSVDSVDLIPQILRERFKFVLFSRADGSNFSCDVAQCLCVCYAKDQIFIMRYAIVRFWSWDEKVRMRTNFFSKRTKNRARWINVSKSGIDGPYISLRQPSGISIANAMKRQNVYSSIPGPGNKSEAQGWEETTADEPYAPAAKHAGIFFPV